MDRDDIRIDTRDSEDNIHEIYITTKGELIIWSMDKAGRTTSKSYGFIHPMTLFHRAAEMSILSRKLMKDDTESTDE